jgi:hypothetical protein
MLCMYIYICIYSCIHDLFFCFTLGTQKFVSAALLALFGPWMSMVSLLSISGIIYIYIICMLYIYTVYITYIYI